MTSSTPAPSDVTISSSPSNDLMDHNIILETVPDETLFCAKYVIQAKSVTHIFAMKATITSSLPLFLHLLLLLSPKEGTQPLPPETKTREDASTTTNQE